MNRYTAVLFLFKDQEQVALAVGQEVGCKGGEHWSFAVECIVAGGGGFCNPPVVGFLTEHQIGNAVDNVPVLYKSVT